MTLKEQLLQELEHTPDPVLEQILIKYLKKPTNLSATSVTHGTLDLTSWRSDNFDVNIWIYGLDLQNILLAQKLLPFYFPD